MTTDYLQATIFTPPGYVIAEGEYIAVSLGIGQADERHNLVFIFAANASVGTFKHLDIDVSHRVVAGKLHMWTSTNRQVYLHKIWSLKWLFG